MAKMKVLLVDDEADFLELISGRIKSWGYEVKTSLSGKEAIEILREKDSAIDIVVLDYMMPVLDGVATLREIRQIDKDLPVIMFTAYPEMEVIKGADELGVSAFIPKLSAYSDVQSSLKAALGILEKKLNKA
jgi:CheY-like chemotaxis protein